MWSVWVFKLMCSICWIWTQKPRSKVRAHINKYDCLNVKNKQALRGRLHYLTAHEGKDGKKKEEKRRSGGELIWDHASGRGNVFLLLLVTWLRSLTHTHTLVVHAFVHFPQAALHLYCFCCLGDSGLVSLLRFPQKINGIFFPPKDVILGKTWINKIKNKNAQRQMLTFR